MHILRFSDLVAAGQVAGKRVFIRADLNVPQDDAGRITEDTRIRASVPCVRMALEAGAAVMVTSHLGRPTEGAFKPEDTLAPVAQRLGELLGREVPLKSDWVGGVDVAPGQVDLGTTTLPFADPWDDLPLFRVTCLGEPHPHYGRVILTYDPGFALTSGKCADVGKITLQSMRGLAPG